jgi:hypothetical protein
MPKYKSHVHAQHEYFGEFEAWPLVWWLNNKNRPSGDPVEKLVELHAALRKPIIPGGVTPHDVVSYAGDLVEQAKLGMTPLFTIPVPDDERSASAERQPKGRRGKRPVKPQAAIPAAKPTSKAPLSVTWLITGNMNASAALAVFRLFTLAERGLLHRVRRCAWNECRNWFFARFDNQVFCATKCQQDFNHAKPEWKEKRRTYMKQHRHNKKIREARQDQAWIRAAKRKK